MEYDKLANEKTEMQRHYVMVRDGDPGVGPGSLEPGPPPPRGSPQGIPGSGWNLSVPSELSQPPSAGHLEEGG